jgi:hypothetical protein
MTFAAPAGQVFQIFFIRGIVTPKVILASGEGPIVDECPVGRAGDNEVDGIVGEFNHA